MPGVGFSGLPGYGYGDNRGGFGVGIEGDSTLTDPIMSGDELHKLLFRTVRLESVGALNLQGLNLAFQMLEITIDGIVSQSGPADETELALYWQTRYPSPLPQTLAASTGGVGLKYLLNIDFSDPQKTHFLAPDTFSFLFQLVLDDGVGGSVSNDPGAGSGSAFTATFFGYPVAMYDITGSNTGSIDIFPVQFWEYTTAEVGTPTWDAATGAKLIDPVPSGV